MAPPYWLEVTAVIICVAIVIAVTNLCGFSIITLLIQVPFCISLHDAYKGVGGNHSGDAKFEYCINHLPVIPIETKLVFTSEN